MFRRGKFRPPKLNNHVLNRVASESSTVRKTAQPFWTVSSPRDTLDSGKMKIRVIFKLFQYFTFWGYPPEKKKKKKKT